MNDSVRRLCAIACAAMWWLMRSSVVERPSSAHREITEIRPSRMAKADLRKADARVQIGRVIRRAAELAGLTRLQQLAAAVHRDERQVARWMDGTERPHFDALIDVEELQQPLVIAFAELTPRVEIETIVRVRRNTR